MLDVNAALALAYQRRAGLPEAPASADPVAAPNAAAQSPFGGTATSIERVGCSLGSVDRKKSPPITSTATMMSTNNRDMGAAFAERERRCIALKQWN